MPSMLVRLHPFATLKKFLLTINLGVEGTTSEEDLKRSVECYWIWSEAPFRPCNRYFLEITHRLM